MRKFIGFLIVKCLEWLLKDVDFTEIKEAMQKPKDLSVQELMNIIAKIDKLEKSL